VEVAGVARRLWLYIIANAEIEGFDQRELRLMANIAPYHRKALPAYHHPEYMSLAPKDRRLVRLLGALLRLADGLDLDHSQFVEAVTIVENVGGLALELQARDEPKHARRAIERLGDLSELECAIPVPPAAGTN
jgi:exopolyphosphatase / guanosine-5'-triphosphate,3'-diphosphate pyrophosphatase